MNKLADEKSPYLRHASTQKIDWYPWSDEAFELAHQEDKPVFLSTGAVWCHWCHVMAKESFEDEETARLLNEHFIAIKLDRDERPDIDRRYQQAVAAMGSGGGWPLSVFLTPDKHPFYGGTYFPPEDRQGRPGFKKVLRAVSDHYKTKRGDVEGYARRVLDSLKPETPVAGDLSESSLMEAQHAILAVVDQRNGGFGAAPKFPMPGALEFLLRRAGAGGDPAVGDAARRMLEAMAAGGFHDQLGGGFHRYSVDEAWTIPHFEKMADDNAGLLRNYIDGYTMFGDERFREVALGIVAFTREVLSDPAGGFYASQDADVTPDDEGGYFTWTGDEFRKVLDPDEYAVLSLYLMPERGSMHHDPAKQVLAVTSNLEDLAAELSRDIEEVRRLFLNGKKKLIAARTRRETPFIDTTLYTSLNGMLIASYFHAYSVIGNEELRRFAVHSLERILNERFINGRLYHTENITAVLDDYVQLIDALIAGYEATAASRYLALADELMVVCVGKFHDPEEGGFFDTEDNVLGTRLKRIEDVPHASANALAIMLLLKLSLMIGKDSYRQQAEQSLRLFARAALEMSVHAGAFFCAYDAFYRMLKLTVEALPDGELARAARALTGTTYTVVLYGEMNNRVIPCTANTCYDPIIDSAKLRDSCAKLQG
ncbi:MAG: thioredoxin domain-containing protein [Nitrospirae bacterium]|nr:thioredoxin domain-containing protein [Nitrospirota bacterium]